MKLTWLGQAGFRLRTAKGLTVLIDPYLSDSLHLQKGDGYRREVPLRPDLLKAPVHILILTHPHGDHMDFGTLDPLLAANGPVDILAPLAVLDSLRSRYGRPENYMLFEPGVEITLDALRVRAVYAAHSGGQPTGVVMEDSGMVLCHTGDTMYHRRLLEELPRGADLLMLPINGTGYNMNAADAARLTRALAPKAVMPIHWDMFRAYGCSVEAFTDRFSPEDPIRVLTPRQYEEFEI